MVKKISRSKKTNDERCYVIYGKGFVPLKIKGLDNKKKLLSKIKRKGHHPKSARWNCKSAGRITGRPTKY